jgi:hypothetical protein
MRHTLLLFFALLLPMTAFADDSPAAVQARLDTELACIERVSHSLATTTRLLSEARTQLTSSPAGSAAGRDAAAAVVSLEQRVAVLSHTLGECIPSSASQAAQGVVYVEPPRDRAAEQVARDAPSLEVLERDVAITSAVRVVLAEKVDGRGRVRAASVNAGVHRIGGRLAACYDRLVDRGALVSGRAMLVFTITPRGAVTRVSTEGSTLGDSRFTRCLRDAGRRLRVGEPALGGDATFSYTLGFGPR